MEMKTFDWLITGVGTLLTILWGLTRSDISKNEKGLDSVQKQINNSDKEIAVIKVTMQSVHDDVDDLIQKFNDLQKANTDLLAKINELLLEIRSGEKK